MTDYLASIQETLYDNKIASPHMSTSSTMFFWSDYGLNIFIVFMLLLLILFLYVINRVSIDEKNWDIQKCNPKYLFFSGYIRRNPDQSSYDSTVNNFYECNNKIIQGLQEDVIDSDFGRMSKSLKQDITSFDNINKAGNKSLNMDISNQLYEIEQYEKDMSMDISGDSVFAYTYLKNIGVYMDQLNAYLDYIGEYVRKVLTYKMVEHANNCMSDANCQNEGHSDYANAIKIKNILDSYYGGTNL